MIRTSGARQKNIYNFGTKSNLTHSATKYVHFSHSVVQKFKQGWKDLKPIKILPYSPNLCLHLFAWQIGFKKKPQKHIGSNGIIPIKALDLFSTRRLYCIDSKAAVSRAVGRAVPDLLYRGQ